MTQGNPLQKLATFGQSIWLDYIRRGMFASGELKKYIDQDDLRGVTSNPAPAHGQMHSIALTLPPLAALLLVCEKAP